MKVKGFLIVLSGPSGSGKNTLISRVLPRIPNLKYSVSATTRAPRSGEVDGVHYFFVSDHQFDQMIAKNEFLEWAEFVGNRYGTPRPFVEKQIQQGHTVIMDVDIQGAVQIKRLMSDVVLVFLLPPTLDELRNRLKKRGQDATEAIAKRLEHSSEELEYIVDYDYYIVNDDLDRAAERLVSIINAERCRVARADLSAIQQLWQRRQN
ncbi:MAG TPA: guanylate kinase [Limnochordia bacterium]|nr:guanylate kinase [Bacillota bacterium]HKM17095.1 guanylate kinase [Limnochordia bacterium]